MRTLIIPCGGNTYIDGKPQYLNRHPNGKLLIERCMEGICPESFDRIIAVILRQDADAYEADRLLLEEFSDKYPFEVVILPQRTSGPADTVYYGITQGHIQGSIIVKDVDNYVKIPTDKIATDNFVAGLDLNHWDRDIHNLRNKSFLILNEQGNLLDVIEKQFKSDVISLGLYGFKSAEDFISAYTKLNDSGYPIDRLYLSHVISYLIGYSGKIFQYVPATAFENWSDDRHWKDLQADYALRFLNLDNEWDRQKLLSLQQHGATFVGFSAKDRQGAELSLRTLEQAGIHFLDVIYNCPWSQTRIVMDKEM